MYTHLLDEEPLLIGKWKNNRQVRYPKTKNIGLRLSDGLKHEVTIIQTKS